MRIPALLIRTAGDDSVKKMVVAASANGKNDVFVEPLRSLCRAALAEGRAVLAIDQRLRGEWAHSVAPPGELPELTWKGNLRWWGRPELGMAVRDIRAAISFLATRKDCAMESLRVAGAGETAGFAALLAAGLDQRIEQCVADANHSNFSEGMTDRPPLTQVKSAPDHLKRAPLLPGVLRYGDLGEFAALVAPRRLTLLNLSGDAPLQTADAVYRLLGADRQFIKTYDREIAVANAQFDEGPTGWRQEDGDPIDLAESGSAAGKSALRLKEGRAAISAPVAVEPSTQYRLVTKVFKSERSTLQVFLVRNGESLPVMDDLDGRLTFQNSETYFSTRPQETVIRIGYRASGLSPDGGILVDSVRLFENHPVQSPEPDGKELLAVTGVDNLELGTTITPDLNGTFSVFYGPGHENKVVPEGREARHVLYAKPKPGAYVGFMPPIREPLQVGGLYRFEVVARGKGVFDMAFVSIYPYHSPRLGRVELTDEWKTYSLELFVGSDPLLRAQPVAQIMNGEMRLDRMSLKLVR